MSSTLMTIRHLLSTEDESSEETASRLLKDLFTLDEKARKQHPTAQPIYIYKKGLISIAMHDKPKTKDDFFELAQSLVTRQYRQHAVECFHQLNGGLSSELLHELRCNLLSDASRAGHEEAMQQLITMAATQGDTVAARNLELKVFHCKDGLRIFLPKLFKTAEELQMLGIHLRDCGIGLYYRMEKPEYCHKLSQHFLKIAGELRKKEYDMMMEKMRKFRLEDHLPEQNSKTRNLTHTEDHDPVREMYLKRVTKRNQEQFEVESGEVVEPVQNDAGVDGSRLGYRNR